MSFYLIINNYSYPNISLYSKNNDAFNNTKSESLKQYFSQLETKINSIKDNTFQENIILKNDLNNIINTEAELKNTMDESSQTNIIMVLEEKIKNLEDQLNNIKSKLDDDIQINLVQPNSDNNDNINDNSINPTNQNTIVVDPIANYDRAKLLDPLVDPRGRTSGDQIPAPIIAAQFNFPTQGILDRYHRVGLLMAVDHNNNKRNTSDNDSIFDNEYKKSIKEKSIEKKQRYNDNQSSNNTPAPYRGVQIADNKSIEGFESSGNTYNYINYDSSENDILELIGKKITDNWYKYFTSISKGNKIIKINVHNRNRKELYSGDEVYIPELHKRYIVKIDYMDQIEYNPYLF
jgi:hypothetical protein